MKAAFALKQQQAAAAKAAAAAASTLVPPAAAGSSLQGNPPRHSRWKSTQLLQRLQLEHQLERRR
jgi:hypothetical protein